MASALSVVAGEMVAFVGAGGKTSAAWRVASELMTGNRRVVFTTTTRILQPRAEDIALIIASQARAAQVEQRLEDEQLVVLGAEYGEQGTSERVTHSPYPAETTKLVGLPADIVEGLAEVLPCVTWLVEADGARGRVLKAPADHEPVIPSRADRVVVVAGLDAVGSALDERVVHRSAIAARLLGLHVGAPITPAMVARLILHPRGGMKDVPSQASVVALLTQWEGAARADVEIITKQLLQRGRVARVVWADLRGSRPVLEVWCD